MRWFKRHPWETAAGAAMAIGALMLGFALVNHLSSDSRAQSAPSAPSTGLPQNSSIDDVPTGTSKSALGANGRNSFSGAGKNSLNGLQGHGGVTALPKKLIVLRVTSAAPIGYVGYQVPTSPDKYYGVDKKVGTSWSLSTTGYGRPDYAQIFSASGPSGVTVTCTITVNGRVTERRTTDGPYSQLYCQG